MAKVQDLKKGLGTLKKKPLIKTRDSDAIVNTLHRGEEEKGGRGRPKSSFEKTIRYTIDIPESIYKKIKYKTIDDGVSMKTYIMGVIEADLENI